MTHFFEKRDRWGHGLALWVLVAMVFIAPPAFWALKQIDLENDIENWLPSDDPQAVALRWYLDNFGHEDRIIVSWENSTLTDPRINRLAARLEGLPDNNGIRRGGLPQVADVITPREIVARIKVEPAEAVRRLQGVLVGSGPLRVTLTDAGRQDRDATERAIREWAKSELAVDISLQEPVAEWFDAHENEETSANAGASMVETAAEADVEFPPVPHHDLQIRWEGIDPNSPAAKQFVDQIATSLVGSPTAESPDGERLIESCFFSPGSPVAVLVTLSEAGEAERAESIAAIRDTAIEVGIPDEALHLGGRPVAGSALNQAVKEAAWNRAAPIYQLHKRSVILLSGIVGIMLAFVVLRSLRLALLVEFISFYTVLLTVSLVPVTGGSMNMVLVVMPTLLLVLAMSGAIHVANYWKHAAHINKRTAVVEAVNMARLPCLLASVTTAIGLLSLATSPLTPVRDFGIYSAVGCLLAYLMVIYGLPSLLQFWPPTAPNDAEIDRAGWKAFGHFVWRRATPITCCSLVVFGLGIYGLKWFQTETKVIRYFPDHSRVVRDYRFLEGNLAGIIPVDVVVRFDEDAQLELNFLKRMELVRGIEQKIRQHPEISGALSLADFRPVSRPLAEGASLRERLLYNRRVNETESRTKAAGSGAESFLKVAKSGTDLSQPGDHGLNKPGDELWRITAQAAIMSDLDYGDLTNDLNSIAQSELKYHAGAGHVVTGMVPVFLRTQQAVLESLIRSFALAFAIIAIVMIIVLKHPLAGAITMIPNLMPVAIVFGGISFAGLKVDIGTMITASVALGIAVDGTLHLLTWFRKGISNGLSREDAIAQALSHCGPAMWQTSFAVGIGLLMLFPAELLLISRFGWLMAAMIGAAFVADIVVLPALLAGPLGRFLERATPQTQPGPEEPEAEMEMETDPTEPDRTHQYGPGLKPHLKIAQGYDGRASHLDDSKS